MMSGLNHDLPPTRLNLDVALKTRPIQKRFWNTDTPRVSNRNKPCLHSHIVIYILGVADARMVTWPEFR
jgi:hypothetical protein